MIDNFNLPFSVFGILKWFYIFAFFLYFVFSIVVIKQVRTMTKTVDIGLGDFLLTISYIHFLFAIGVMIFFLIVL